jgi:hypothetical protein
VATYAPFVEGQPDDGVSQNCGATYTHPTTGERGLRDLGCSSDRDFVCEVAPDSAPSPFNGSLCADFPDGCPCDLYTSDAKVYALCPSALDLRSHDSYCARLGMTAARPTSEQDGRRLLQLAREQLTAVRYALDLDGDGNGGWRWGDGSALTYDLWDTLDGEPDNGGQTCMAMWADDGMLWHDTACTSDMPIVCEMPRAVEPGCTDNDGDGYGAGCSLGADCDDTDWSRNPSRPDVCDGEDNDCSGQPDDDNDRCACEEVSVTPAAPDGGVGASTTYRLCDEALSWPRAHNRCLAQGGDLASIDDAETNLALIAEAQGRGLTAPWFGLNDRASEGTFVWADGTTPAFTYWGPNEPNDSGGEDCAQLYYSNADNTGSWNDQSCTSSYDYVCRP